MCKYMNINIPKNFKKKLILNKENISLFLFNNVINVNLPLKSKNSTIQLDNQTNSIVISYKSVIHENTFTNIRNILFSYSNFFFKKIKFKGKGFRLKLKKQRKIFKFLFGHSHLVLTLIKNIKLYKCGKYKFLFKMSNRSKLNLIIKKIIQIKKNNIYTNRGLRESRQYLFKRKIKKTTNK